MISVNSVAAAAGRAAPSSGNARSYNGHYMKAGKEAETRVLQWLRENPNILGVNDLRDVKSMQEADVDCSFSLRDGTVTLAEIKSDYHLGKSGNVLFEVLRINHTAPPDRACTLGWTARTPAVYLLYYAPQVNAIYQCRFDDFRRVYQRYTGDVREKLQMRIVATDEIKTTVNVLIPWAYCEDVFRIYQLTEPAPRDATARQVTR